MTTRQSQHAALMLRRAARAAAIEAAATAVLRAEYEAVREIERKSYHAEYDLARRLDPIERLWLDSHRRPDDFPPFPVPRSYSPCDIYS